MEKKTKQKKNDKQLRKLNREELLEMLINQIERSETLEKQLESEIRKNDKTNLIIKESGSMAEALLKLNGVFDATEAASNEYYKLLELKGEVPLTDPEQEAEKIVAAAREKAERILRKTKEKCNEILEYTKEIAERYLKEAQHSQEKEGQEVDEGANTMDLEKSG